MFPSDRRSEGRRRSDGVRQSERGETEGCGDIQRQTGATGSEESSVQFSQHGPLNL